MTTSKFFKSISLLFLLSATACRQSEYSKLVREELSKDVRRDSVFLGLMLGETKESFRDKCTSLNKERLITMGARMSILHHLRDSLNPGGEGDLRLLIFPYYDALERVSNIDIEFSYVGWAPWNEKYQSERLESKVKDLFKTMYHGNDFIYIEIDGKPVPVKVDGNRRVILKTKDSQTVVAMIQDLTNKKFLGK